MDTVFIGQKIIYYTTA